MELKRNNSRNGEEESDKLEMEEHTLLFYYQS